MCMQRYIKLPEEGKENEYLRLAYNSKYATIIPETETATNFIRFTMLIL